MIRSHAVYQTVGITPAWKVRVYIRAKPGL